MNAEQSKQSSRDSQSIDKDIQQQVALKSFCESQNITLSRCKHLLDTLINQQVTNENSISIVNQDKVNDFHTDIIEISKLNKIAYSLGLQIFRKVIHDRNSVNEEFVVALSEKSDKIKGILENNSKAMDNIMDKFGITFDNEKLFEEIVEKTYEIINFCRNKNAILKSQVIIIHYI